MNFFKQSIFLLACVLMYGGHYAKGGRWIIDIQTADTWMAGYVGDITVCLNFETPKVAENATATADHLRNNVSNVATKYVVKEDCQVLPKKHFQRGKSYVFAVDYAEDASLEKVRILTKPSKNDQSNQICKQKSGDAWHIEAITFQSMATGEFFQLPKSASPLFGGNLIVGGKCGSHGGELTLSSFNRTIQPRPCPWSDGVIYKNGEKFEDGCSGICVCRDSGVRCVSRCPPYMALGCRQVYIPDQCCPTFICEETGSPIACSPYEASDCETSNRTVDPGESPWIAFVKLCERNNSCDRFCSGALLNDRWILTAAECFSWDGKSSLSPSQVRVIVGEQTLILAEDSDVEIDVVNITVSPGNGARLALIKLKEPVSFDRAAQPVVLPLNRDQCSELVQPSCALSVTGWINIGATEAQQYELYKLTAQIEHQSTCGPSVTPVQSSRRRKPPPPPSRHKDNNICVDFGTADPALHSECGSCPDMESNSPDTCSSDNNVYLCSGERGRPLVSKVQVSGGGDQFLEVNYLVGIISYQLSANESAAGLCKKPAYRLALNICDDLNWITTVINSYY